METAMKIETGTGSGVDRGDPERGHRCCTCQSLVANFLAAAAARRRYP